MYIKDVPGMAYLSRKIKTYVPCEYPVMMMEDDDETSGKSDEEDWLKNFDAKMAKDPFEADSKDEKRPLIILHHVLWSMSYSVPVLYFNGWKSGKRFSIPIMNIKKRFFDLVIKLIVNHRYLS